AGAHHPRAVRAQGGGSSTPGGEVPLPRRRGQAGLSAGHGGEDAAVPVRPVAGAPAHRHRGVVRRAAGRLPRLRRPCGARRPSGAGADRRGHVRQRRRSRPRREDLADRVGQGRLGAGRVRPGLPGQEQRRQDVRRHRVDLRSKECYRRGDGDGACAGADPLRVRPGAARLIRAPDRTFSQPRPGGTVPPGRSAFRDGPAPSGRGAVISLTTYGTVTYVTVGFMSVTSVDMGFAGSPVRPRLRGWLHAGALPVTTIAGFVLVALGPTLQARIAAAVYAAASGLLFGVSAAYHRGVLGPRATEVLRRIDHANIYLIIAGTYTPFALLALDGAARAAVLGTVWTGAVAGVLFRVLWIDAPRMLYTGLY